MDRRLTGVLFIISVALIKGDIEPCSISIQELDDFTLSEFGGVWKDWGHIYGSGVTHGITSLVLNVGVSGDSTFSMAVGGTRAGSCMEPVSAQASLEQSTHGAFSFSGTDLAFLFPTVVRVIATDYTNYAILYACADPANQQAERCAEEYRMVLLLGRGNLKLMGTLHKLTITNILQSRLCEHIKHVQPGHNRGGEECEIPEVEAARVCKYSDIRPHGTVSHSQLTGRWYVLAAHSESGGGAKDLGSAVMYLQQMSDTSFVSYYTAAVNGQCFESTTKGSLEINRDTQGIYRAKYGTFDGELIWTYLTDDQQYALTYQCSGLTATGACLKATIDVLGRTTDFPEHVRVLMRTRVQSLCAPPSEFADINQEQSCELDMPAQICLVSNIRPTDNVEWRDIAGEWYATGYHRHTPPAFVMWTVHTVTMTRFNASYTSKRDGICYSGEALDYTFEGTRGVFTMDGVERMVLFFDGSTIMVIYRCRFVLPDGSCDPISTELFYLTRQRSLTSHHVRSLNSILTHLCLSEQDIRLAQESECIHEAEIPEENNEIQNNGKNLTETCVAPKQDNLDIEKLSGSWKSTALSNTEGAEFVQLLIDVTSAETLHVWYRGRHGEACLLSHHIELSYKDLNSTYELQWSSKRKFGNLNVVYTDYDNVLILQFCGKKMNTQCVPWNSVTMLLRRPNVVERERLLELCASTMARMCLTAEQLSFSPEDVDCPPIRTSDKCPLDAIPTQENFQFKQFVGDWYRIGITEEHDNLDSVQVRVTLTTQTEFTLAISGSKEDECEQTITLFAQISKNHAVHHLKVGRFVARQIVLYQDTMFAVIYRCTDILPTGICASRKSYMVFYARTARLAEEDQAVYEALVTRYTQLACHDPLSIHPVEQTWDCIPEVAHTECYFANLPVLRDIDLNQLIGTWYAVMRLRGSATLDGTVVRFDISQQGQLTETVTGVSPTKNSFECIAPATASLKQAPSGDLTFQVYTEDTKGRMNFISATTEALLIYECDQLTLDGRCHDGQVSVDLLSRTRTMDARLKDVLLRRVLDLCVDPDHMEDVPHDVECSVDPAVLHGRCDFDLTPSPPDLHVYQLAGSWRHAARWAHSPGVEAQTIHYSLESEPSIHINTSGWSLLMGACVHFSRTLYPVPGFASLLSVNSPDSDMKMALLALSEDRLHLLSLSCTDAVPLSDCSPDHSLLDVFTKMEEMAEVAPGGEPAEEDPEVPQDVLNEFGRLVFSKLCHKRVDFVRTEQEAVCSDVAMTTTTEAPPPPTTEPPLDCTLNGIQGVSGLSIQEMRGDWFGFSQLYNSMFMHSSAYSIRRDDNMDLLHRDPKYSILVTGSRSGRCYKTARALLWPEQDGRYTLQHKVMTRDIQATLLVLYADNATSLIYQCYATREDGTCFPEERSVVILTRQRGVLETDLQELEPHVLRACVEPSELRTVSHEVECDIQYSTPRRCDIGSVQRAPPTFNFDDLLGTWHVQGKLRGTGAWDSGVVEIQLIQGSGHMIRVHSCVAVQGECRPTQVVTLRPRNDEYTEWMSFLPTGTGDMVISYVDASTLVMYECDHQQTDGSCHPNNRFIEVLGRSPSPMDTVSMRKLSPMAETMCLRLDDFEAVSTQVECGIDHEVFMDCAIHQLPIAHNLTFDQMSGTWYAVARLKGTGSFNDHVIRITKDDTSGVYIMHTTGTRKGRCLSEGHRTLERILEGTDAEHSVHDDLMKGMERVLRVYRREYMLVYWCAKIMEGDRCTPSLGGLLVYSREKEISRKTLGHLLGTASTCGFNIEDYEMVPHTIGCPLHGESDDEYCDFNTIRGQPALNLTRFSGVWHHLYRIRWSDHAYDGAVDHIEILRSEGREKRRIFTVYHSVAPTGDGPQHVPFQHPDPYLIGVDLAFVSPQCVHIRSRANNGKAPTHRIGIPTNGFVFRDGQCTDTKTNVYKPSMIGDSTWWTDFGNLNIVYTDYSYAVMYTCAQGHHDGSCFRHQVRMHIMARKRGPIPDKTRQVIYEALRNMCFEPGDFVPLDLDVTCILRHVGCPLNMLPEQPEVDMTQMTGTWQAVAQLRDTWRYSSVTVTFREDSPNHFSSRLYLASAEGCEEKHTRLWRLTRQATLLSPHTHEMMKILSTDYRHSALLYVCHELENDTTCLPGSETVLVLSRAPERDHWRINTLVKEVPQTCFTKRDFEWLEIDTSGVCSAESSGCRIEDLPRVANPDLPALRGRWFSRYQSRAAHVRHNMVVTLDILESGQILLSQAGSRDVEAYECEDTLHYTLQRTYVPWHWHLITGGKKGLLHMLAASVDGSYSLLLYECDHTLPDGTCDPDTEYIQILTRIHDRIAEHMIQYFAGVLQRACFQFGDLAPVSFNGSIECPIFAYNAHACRVTSLRSSLTDLNIIKFSGTWYVVAKLEGSVVMESATLILHYHNNSAISVKSYGYRPTRGCVVTDEITMTMTSQWEWAATDDGQRHSLHILWTDFTAALIYWCTHVQADGLCEAGYGRGLVISRRFEPLRSETRDHIIAAVPADQPCTDPRNYRQLPIVDEPCVYESEQTPQCLVADIPLAANVIDRMLAGAWRLMYTLRRHATLDSLTVFFKALTTGVFKTQITWERDGECDSLETFLTPTSQRGQYTLRMGKETAILKIVYLDGENSLAYVCTRVETSGVCADGAEYIAGLRRNLDHVSGEALAQGMKLCQEMCHEPGDFVTFTHSDECEGKQTMNLTTLSCGVNELPVQENFNLEKFTGTWYATARIKSTPVQDSSVLRITRAGDSKYTITSAGLDITGKCEETDRATIYEDKSLSHGSYYAYYPNHTGHVQVIYTDYSYALLYECALQATDSLECGPGDQSVALYSRKKTIADDVVNRVVATIASNCFSRDDFTPVPQTEECPLQNEDAIRCKVRNIPAKGDLNMTQLLGSWHSVYKEPGSWDAVTFTFTTTRAGRHVAYYIGSRDGECTSEYSLPLEDPVNGRGVFYEESVITKILYADDVHLVLYVCEDVEKNGDCSPGRHHVVVLTRNLAFALSQDKLETVHDVLRSACFEPGDLVPTTHTVRCEPIHKMTCSEQDLPVMSNLDLDRMTGTWYNMMRMRTLGNWQSGVFRLEAEKYGLYTAYTTYSHEGKCAGTQSFNVQTAADMESVVEFINNRTHEKSYMTVLATNYELALEYYCDRKSENGECAPGHENVAVISKTTNITSSDVTRLIGDLDSPCFTPQDFIWADRQVECDLDLPATPRCTFQAFTEHVEGVHVQAIDGTWYARYRLKHSARFMPESESIVFYFMANGNLKIANTGAENGECSGLSEVTIAGRTNTASLWSLDEGAILKVLYADGDYMAIYGCDYFRPDGACAKGQHYLYLLSHNMDETIPKIVVGKFYEAAKSVCIEHGEIEEAIVKESCQVSLGSEWQCPAKNMSLMSPFDMEQFTGTWYGVAKSRGSAVANELHMRIEKSDNQYTTTVRSARRGQCRVRSSQFKDRKTPDNTLERYDLHLTRKLGYHYVLFTDYESALVYTCRSLNPDGTCAEGDEALLILSRDPDPAQDGHILYILLAANTTGCLNVADFEPLHSTGMCQAEQPLKDRCKFASVEPQPEVTYASLSGPWYSAYVLRASVDLEAVRMRVLVLDDRHLQIDFAYSIGGKCRNVRQLLHAHGDQPGVFMTSQGRVSSEVRLLLADEQHLVMYECEHTRADGACDAPFVVIYARQEGELPVDVTKLVFGTLRDVCLERGDFKAAFSNNVCEVKVEEREVRCSYKQLPVVRDYTASKDTGVWYAVAKLMGSNLMQGHREIGVETETGYSYYITGNRPRGGCAVTQSISVPPQPMGEQAGIQHFDQDDHLGVWQTLYNDYQHSLVYECLSLQHDHTCKTRDTILALYSRKPERPEMQVISRIFRNIPDQCFTWRDFTWTFEDKGEECLLEYNNPDRRVRQIPAAHNFNIDQMLGTWFSRRLLAQNANLESFALLFERTQNDTLRLYYNGVSDENCKRPVIYDINLPDPSRAYIWRTKVTGSRSQVMEGASVSKELIKVIWTDYSYAAMYVCEEVNEEDYCLEGKEFIDVIGRNLDPIPIVVIEKLKTVLQRIGYASGDFVESDHMFQCNQYSCTVASVVTSQNIAPSSLYGRWQLLATTHLQAGGGASTMEIMIGNSGTARLAMTTYLLQGCEEYEGTMPAEEPGVFYYTSRRKRPGVAKVIHYTDDHIVMYGCFGVEPEDGFCPEENEGIQLWGRQHHLVSGAMITAIQVAKRQTCVNMDEFDWVPPNTRCDVVKSCKFMDMVSMDHFDFRSALGRWKIFAKSIFYTPVYSSGTMTIGYSNGQELTYKYSGMLVDPQRCSLHSGRIRKLSNDVYEFDYRGVMSSAKFLFSNSDYVIIFECWGDLVDGICPEKDAGFHILGREYTRNETISRRLIAEIQERTYGCYDVTKIMGIPQSDCPEGVASGKPSCTLADVEAVSSLDVRSLAGLWYLSGRSDLVPLKLDSGILQITSVGERRISMKYTGLQSYDSDQCIGPHQVEVTQTSPSDGEFTTVSQRLDGLKSTAKLLHSSHAHLIWYECEGNQFTAQGACEAEHEITEIFSRSSDINKVEWDSLTSVITQRTCVNMQRFVRANHTYACSLPGVTLETRTPVERPHSCMVDEFLGMRGVNLERMSGLWYEVERTRSQSEHQWKSGLVLISQDIFTQRFHYSLAGTVSHECRGPVKAWADTSELSDNRVDLLMHLGEESLLGNPWSVTFWLKVLFTDYEVAVVYSCLDVDPGGQCARDREHLSIISRSRDVNIQTMSRVYDVISESVCIDVYSLVKPEVEDNCHGVLGMLEPVRSAAQCAQPQCHSYCPHGYRRNRSGCSTCECNPMPSPAARFGES